VLGLEHSRRGREKKGDKSRIKKVGQTVRQRARRSWEEDEEKAGRVNEVEKVCVMKEGTEKKVGRGAGGPKRCNGRD
jgi:hypothetical protein